MELGEFDHDLLAEFLKAAKALEQSWGNSVTPGELADTTRIAGNSARPILKALRNNGIIERDKQGRY